MSLPAQLQLGAQTTNELRELLENEEKITQIVRGSEKFQRLHQAAENMLISNQNLAKVSISQKPTFSDTKMLLAMKYKEVEKLRSITQAKQEQLAEKNTIHHAQHCLQQRINHSEEEFELLFQMFAEGKTTLADFLDSFLSSRKLHHIRLVLVNKLQEITRDEETTTLSEAFPEYFSMGFPDQIHPVCSLTTAVVLPTFFHPPFLLPLGGHINAALCLQHTPFWSDDDESLHIRRSHRWSARPVRLQPLKEQRRHQQQ
ncbi:vacuolar protein sorting-associated protein 37A-like [Melanotaenia boesemani]|uniref:vacuolar protein sorting-associated protein 37A-like n=1 Tax=Melanotaenia boesemani TaxID=1250792 RepID=UPI001C03E453|nr:vacuolar protein sorting-associated protein 37A-like [Melanotaenia boesemani]